MNARAVIHATLMEAVRGTAHRLTGAPQDYDPLMNLIGDARFVLLGEASHGTHEFYRERALITKRLIREKDFAAVAVEAACFDHFGEDTQVYGFVTGTGLAKSCEEEVVNQLVELQRRAVNYARRDGRVAEEEFFYVEQNAW